MSDIPNLTLGDLASEVGRFGVDLDDVTRDEHGHLTGLRIDGGTNPNQAIWLHAEVVKRDDEGEPVGKVVFRFQFSALTLSSVETEA